MRHPRPAKFILWRSSGEFFVSKRGRGDRLLEIEKLSHFHSFHSTESAAWATAARAQEWTIKEAEERLKRYMRLAKAREAEERLKRYMRLAKARGER